MIEKELEKWARQNLPVYEFIDLKIVRASDGFYQCTVPLCRNTGNHINTVHAAFQWASAEILGGLVVLSNRTSEKYVPVVRSLNIEFKQPAMSAITSEATFTNEQVEEMNSTLESAGRFDFELCSVIRDENGEIVAESQGRYAVRTLG